MGDHAQVAGPKQTYGRERARLVERMAAEGLWPSRAPWIRQAMAEDRPRHAFAPGRLWWWDGHAYVPVDREADEARWAALVYGGPYDSTVTQVTDGLATSSLSCPSVVADMLDSLLLEEAHRVLELGTATGWNTALLTSRTGPGRVTSLEADAGLAEQARTNLAAAGVDARVETADGTYGRPSGAPYDRLIATYAVETVPWAWVTQVRAGGRIVTPWGRLGHVALTVAEDGTAASGWMQGLATFMPSRTDPRRAPGPRAPEAGTRAVDRDLEPLRSDAHVLFALRVALPEVRIGTGTGAAGAWTVHLDDDAGSWTDVTGSASGAVARLGGPRRLLDEVEEAWDLWRAYGSPQVYDYGLTVEDAGRRQYVWAWDPATGPRW